MSERIFIFDTTLRDGEQSPGSTMTIDEKISMANQLEILGVDIIEAGFPAASKGDFESVKEISSKVKCQVAGLSRVFKNEIDITWDAIKNSYDPRIHIFLATSNIHMETKLNKKPEHVLEMIEDAVSHAKKYTNNIEFSAEDASRSDKYFLTEALNRAIIAGASVVNVPDTVGYSMTDEFGDLIKYLIKNVKNSDKAVFSVHCHNDLGLASANTLAAIKAGARQIEGTITGIGERAGNTALEEVIMAMHTRNEYFGVHTCIKTEQIFKTCRLLSMITAQSIPLNKAIVGSNAFSHEAGIHQDGIIKDRRTYEIITPASIGKESSDLVIGKHSGRHALKRKLAQLNLKICKEDLEVIFEYIKDLADKKIHIYDEDIEAIVMEQIYNKADRYSLCNMSVVSGNMGVMPTASLVIRIQNKEGDFEKKQQASFGCGPVDAVFNAINVALNRKPSLERFTINAITGGADALGEVMVKISEHNISAIGRCSDPDIIVACARAYISAINRLVKKEE